MSRIKPSLTEEQIERIVERRIDDLDTLYMSRKITQEEYAKLNIEIIEWSEIEYRFRRRTPQ
jgi:hypothetical protein